MRVLRVYPTPSPHRGLCERRKLSRYGGVEPQPQNDFWTFCAILRVYALCGMQVLSLKGSKSSLQRQRITQKQSMSVES